jgi:hypothetical protein
MKPIYPPRARSLQAVTFAALVTLAACEPSTAPQSQSLNTTAALSDYKAMQNVFTSETWTAFRAVGPRSPLAASTALSAMGNLDAMTARASDRTSARDFAVGLFRDMAAVAGPSTRRSEAIISSVHRGKTLVYSAATDRYVIDPARTGAPDNGTRFVLYNVDANGKPIVAQEIGYADLTDESIAGSSATALRLVGVQRGRTMLDYKLRAEPRSNGGTIDVSGFVQNDSDARLEFEIGVVGATAADKTTVDLSFDLGMPTRAFDVSGTVQGVEGGSDGEGTVDLTVHHGDHTLHVDMQGNAGTLDGSIRLDGALFVTVTGPASKPVVLNAKGQTLNGEELLLVLAIVNTTDDVFTLVKDLLKPVDNLLVLGWVL